MVSDALQNPCKPCLRIGLVQLCSFNQGEGDSQFNLGVMYANGQGILQDYQAAAKWTRLAAILRAENPRFSGMLEVWRGDTLCFVPTPLKTAFMPGEQPVNLKRNGD